MINIKFDEIESDDFYLSPLGSQSGEVFYESYLKCIDLFKQVPSALIEKNSELQFYQVLKEVISSRDNNSVLYRRNLNANDALRLLWFSKVKVISNLFLAQNQIPEFRGINSDQLISISKLSADIDNLPKLASILLQYGIVLIYERSIPDMKLDGAVYMSKSGHPVIALSLRYSRLDNFWFTLMHELAHVSLHLETLNMPIFDDLDERSEELIEKEADRLALNSFISRSDWRSCSLKYDRSLKSVITFASDKGIHPAIVAGRLHRELNRYDLYSGLVNSVNVRKVLLANE